MEIDSGGFRHVTYRSFAVGAAAAFVAVLCACSSGAATVSATATDATVRGEVIRLAGKPFFPVMLIDQCTSDDTAHARTLGINLILNEHCDGVSPERQLAMMQRRPLTVLEAASSKVRGSGLVGWTYPDEPENNNYSPQRLSDEFSIRRASPDGLVSFLTTGSGFFRAPFRDPHVERSTYRAYTQLADVAGFDLYPLGHCQKDLTSVYDAQREFDALAGRMPTFQWIETGPIKPEYCGGFAMSPQELKAEVWLAVVGGARGIGFFTHTWSPGHKSFDVRPEVEHAIWQTSSLLAAVRPGLLGAPASSGVNSGAIKVLARRDAKQTYVFAVNTHRAPVVAQIHVPRISNGKITVFGERRSVTVDNAQFVDRFPALGVHVYVQG